MPDAPHHLDRPDSPDGPDTPDRFTMSFGDHLEELRHRVLLGLAVPVPISIVTFLFSNTLIRWLLLPLYKVLARNGLDPEVQALSVPEVLLTKIKLSLVTAVILSAPWILWQFWRFIAPGLYLHERRFVHFLMPGSAILTAAGVALMYFVMLPLMLQVLVTIGAGVKVNLTDAMTDSAVRAVLESGPEIELVTAAPDDPTAGQAWLLLPEQKLYVTVGNADGTVTIHNVPRNFTGGIEQVFRVSYVISFVLMLMLGISIAFQMPLVIVLLGWLGLASPTWLRRHRKYALLVCGVVSAIITPADVISMLAMLVPLFALYELGILMLIIAPADAVAEGSLRFGRRGKQDSTDKPATGSAHPAQTPTTVARGSVSEQSAADPPDDPGDQS